MAAILYEDKSSFANQIITVTNNQELSSAIKLLSSGTGGTVLVDGNAGPYILEAQNLGREGSPVLIKPLDENVTPHVEQINILEASHLTITGMHIDSSRIGATRPAWESDINVRLANDIEIVGNTMDSIADGYRDGITDVAVGERGAMLRDSENITFSYNKISDYRDGIIYLEVKGLTLVGNEITGIQGDGMRGGGIQDVLIAGNYMHDFYGSVQTINHSDMIQIWGTSVDTVTRNVVIRDNILDAGNGAATQSILILNEEFTRTGYYDNIKIHDNVIHNALQQGIGVDHVKDLEVYNNTVLWNAAATTQTKPGADLTSIYPRLIIRDSPDAEIYGNITGESIANEVLLTGDDNIIVTFTDPESDFYVAKHLTNLSGQGDLSLADLAYLPDSPLKDAYGARLTSDPLHESGAIANGDTPDNQAIINMKPLEGSRDGVLVSADLSILQNGSITDNNITVRWTFEDGTVREGVTVAHVFGTTGSHDVTLEIFENGTSITTLTRKFEARHEGLLDLDFNNGAADTSVFESEMDIRDSNNNSFVNGRDGNDAFHLDGVDRVLVDRTNSQITKLETFDLNISFKKDSADTSGILSMLYKAFTLTVEKDGKLSFALKTSDGRFTAITEPGVITDTDWHDIRVAYDSPMGTLAIYLDGEQVATTAASGATTATSGFDLAIGSLFSESVHGLVDKFTLTAPTSEKYDDLSDDLFSELVSDFTDFPVMPPEPTPTPAPTPVVEDTSPEPVIEPEVEIVVEDEENVATPPPTVTPPTPVEATPQNNAAPVITLEDQSENIAELLGFLERFTQFLGGSNTTPGSSTLTNDRDVTGFDLFQSMNLSDPSNSLQSADAGDDGLASSMAMTNDAAGVEDVFAF